MSPEEKPERAKQDQRSVKAHHESVVPVDAPHQRIAQTLQSHQLAKVLCRNGHICGLSCDDSTAAHSNAYISQRKCRRIIDAVADHDHGSARFMLCSDEICLVLRKHLGPVFVDPKLICDGFRNSSGISRQHNRFFDSFRMQRPDSQIRLGPQRVINAKVPPALRDRSR